MTDKIIGGYTSLVAFDHDGVEAFYPAQPFVETWAQAGTQADPASAWFIWKLTNMPAVADLIPILKQYGVDRVTIKVLNAAEKYNAEYGDKPLLAYMDALRAAGIIVEAWGYHYPTSPGPQGDAIEERREKLKFNTYHVDCEGEWNASYGMPAAMKTLLGKLKIGGFTATMCSYRFPSQHPAFPWNAAMNHEAIDAATPQVYFALAHNPEQQLQQTFNEYAQWNKPIYPVGPAFGATFNGTYWEPTVDELIRFRAWCRGVGVPVIYWWSLDWILTHKRYDLLEAATGQNTPPVEPPPPVIDPPYVPVKLVRVTATTLNIRAQPSATATDIGDLKLGSIVPIYRTVGDWHDLGGGWIHKGYTVDA